MKRPYRLDVRLALVVTVMSALTLIVAGTILTLEFTQGQFAIEERGLSSQIRSGLRQFGALPMGRWRSSARRNRLPKSIRPIRGC